MKNRLAQWMLNNPGKINAAGIVLNFWFAADNFEKGGYWLILSALHVAAFLLIAHFQLRAIEIRKEAEEEYARVRRMLERSTWPQSTKEEIESLWTK